MLYNIVRIVLLLFSCIVFFFKQKTAYEMRISDWSSDVCSSDLMHPTLGEERQFAGFLLFELGEADFPIGDLARPRSRCEPCPFMGQAKANGVQMGGVHHASPLPGGNLGDNLQIGRAHV